MDALLRAAEAVLRRSPSPALALSRLTEEVRAATGERVLEPSDLLEALRRHPDRFKVLDPGGGPWRFVAPDPPVAAPEPWIVSLDDPDSPPEGFLAERLQRRLRESVRSVVLAADPESPREVLRWQAVAVAGTRLVAEFGKKAA